MGAGDFPAGVGPAGFDPVAFVSPALQFTPPLAALFDLGTRTFPFMTDGSGRLQSVHPVDQQVNLALGLIEGTVTSVKDLGASFARLQRASLADLQKEGALMANRALARLISNNDIEVREVTATRPIPGRVYIAVNYVNLRLQGTATRSAGFGF